MNHRSLNIYAPANRRDLPRGAAIVGRPDPSGKVVAAIDAHGKRYQNRVTRAAIRFHRARGAKLSLRRFNPEQLLLLASIRTDDWKLEQIHDIDQMEVWSEEHFVRRKAAND